MLAPLLARSRVKIWYLLHKSNINKDYLKREAPGLRWLGLLKGWLIGGVEQAGDWLVELVTIDVRPKTLAPTQTSWWRQKARCPGWAFFSWLNSLAWGNTQWNIFYPHIIKYISNFSQTKNSTLIKKKAKLSRRPTLTSLDDLLPSGLSCLTSEFGKGSGVASSLISRESCLLHHTHRVTALWAEKALLN